ncbi:MAG: UvrD-helicase domain-containing protein [Patescibacteria group bacterium]
MSLLDGLNDAQKAAVTHGEGPLMIVAGAGTGKTTVITKRIAWLIETGRAKQDEILALTFTDKAAGEMEERVDKLLPIGYLDLWISTFHGFCERVLRAHGMDIGLPHGFTLVTDVDAWMLVRRNIDRFNLDYYKPRGNPTKFIQAMLDHFSRAKDEGLTPDAYAEKVTAMHADAEGADVLAHGVDATDEAALERKKWQELADGYRTYQELLLEHNALDFGDLIAYTVELFRTRPNVLKEYTDRFAYVVVDEFQDTNSAQYALVRLLSEPRRNVTVVGDDDQAIYRFRGAALANILRFREDYADAAKIVLTHNYRSGKNILDAAYGLIQQNNPHRLEASEKLDKRLVAANNTEGFVRHVHAATLEDEVKQTVDTITELHTAGAAWSEMAVLVRANDSADPFLAEMDRRGVPYRFLALSGLYTKPVIIDSLAYLRAIDQPNESPSVYRIMTHPRLGLPERDVFAITQHAKKAGLTLYEALQAATMHYEISADGKRRAFELVDLLTNLRAIAKRLPASEMFVEVIKQTGLLADVQQLPERAQEEEFRHLQSFLERVKKFGLGSPDKSLHAFLEEFAHERAAGESGALKPDADDGPDVVSVMTVHGAKGLEFAYVFVVNLVEQRFPAQARGGGLTFPPGLVDDAWSSEDHHREERRLFYVAMTRAKEGLFLMSADDYGGARKKKPSRFLVELGYEFGTRVANATTVPNSLTTDQTVQKSTAPLIYTLPERLSFTQITAFAKCPLQYKYAHILHVPVFGRYQMSFGKSMHNALQRFMEHLLPGKVEPQTTLFEVKSEKEKVKSIPPVNDLLKMLDECWIDEWYPDEKTKDEYRERGSEAMRAFHKQLVVEKPQPAYLEKGFTLKLNDVCVKGRIDRIDSVDGGLEIIDYKTGEAKDEKLSWDDRRQLVLYAMAVEQCFPDHPVVKKLSYYYLESGTTVSFEPDEDDKDKLTNDILDFMTKIQHSDFSPTPGWHCQLCDFRDICEHAAV